MRRPDKKIPSEVKPRPQPEIVTQVRHYKLITPLFGGGVIPGEADPITVVRATEVRGHLRFWWRATRGGNPEGTLSSMKEAEELIWGSAAAEGRQGPSNVIVEVTVTNRGTPRPTDSKSIESYIRIAEDNYNTIREGVEFDLTLRYPATLERYDETFDIGKEVGAALWAWETFGGIGARTRRGAGALKCSAIDKKPQKSYQPNEIQSLIKRELLSHVVEGAWPNDVPHLHRTKLLFGFLSNSNLTAMACWHELITDLKNFRQWRNGKKGFGRTLWPEPEAIRKVTGSRANKSVPQLVNVDKFPRASFGLPIMFDMRHDQGQPKYKLQAQDYDRLASPLILRPIACDGDKAVGLAVILQGVTLPPNIEIEGYGPVETKLTTSEALRIEPLEGDTDVLQAFLEYLQS